MEPQIFLRSLRVDANLTQEILARKIGLSKQAVCNWETSDAFPAKKTLPKIARALGRPVNDLLKIRKELKDARRRRLILSCKDPVVFKSGPSQVPVFSGNGRAFFWDAVKNPEEWTGEKCFLPPDFFPGYIFGYRIADNSMGPLYGIGEVVLADTRQEVRFSDSPVPVLVKVRRQAPVCRLYSSRHHTAVLTVLGDASPKKIDISRLEWCFRILSTSR